MSEDLLFEVKDKVAVMTLNRPEALNAFTPDLLNGWVARLEEVQSRDDINVLLVTGAGRGFCSGGDVKRMGEKADNTAQTTKHRLWTQTQMVAKRMVQLDKPTVAAFVRPAQVLDQPVDRNLVTQPTQEFVVKTLARRNLVVVSFSGWRVA